MPTITFIVNGEKKAVQADAGKTLLQIALDAGVPMEHACGGNGFCTTCLCKVKEGAQNLTPPTDREEGMGVAGEDRLGCQAVANGDMTVEITG
ncbi:MAG: 2Fe-2S iron-sulfur cluster-binding protein [Candidatus Peribacteraceae bacterium]|nr:2Fe-2S iron-sulfur cluster-binding protein [Candidatus Peribacteraceae bacterium]